MTSCILQHKNTTMAECNFPGCTRFAQPNGMCIGHRGFAGSASLPKAEPAKPKQKPIANKSAKKKEVDKELKKMRVLELAINQDCEIKVPGICVHKFHGWHHIQKITPKNATVRSNLVRACNPCNGWIEQNPDSEIALKFTKSKFAK